MAFREAQRLVDQYYGASPKRLGPPGAAFSRRPEGLAAASAESIARQTFSAVAGISTAATISSGTGPPPSPSCVGWTKGTSLEHGVDQFYAATWPRPARR